MIINEGHHDFGRYISTKAPDKHNPNREVTPPLRTEGMPPRCVYRVRLRGEKARERRRLRRECPANTSLKAWLKVRADPPKE